MNTKLIVGLAALLLAVPAISATASTYHRDSLGPTTVAVTAVITAGISFCDDDGTIASINPALLCGTGGVGAIIALDGSAGEDDLNPATTVTGECNVALGTALLGLNGNFSYSCGVDRDDDGFVTNVDADPHGSGTHTYDDDSTGNVAKGTTAKVCFREDLDGAFDDMAVFIAVNVPSTSVSVGTFDIDVSLESTATAGTCTPSSFQDQPPAPA